MPVGPGCSGPKGQHKTMEHFPTQVQLQRDDNEKRVSRLYVVVEKRVQPEINTRHYSNGLSFAATFLPFFLTGVINKGGNISLLFSTSTGAGSVIKQRGLYLANQLSRMKACSQSYRLRSFFFLNINIHRQVRSSEP